LSVQDVPLVGVRAIQRAYNALPRLV
jgi:hypothetical protein